MASGKVGINLTRYFFYAGNAITAERKKALVALAYATSRTLQFAPKAILISIAFYAAVAEKGVDQLAPKGLTVVFQFSSPQHSPCHLFQFLLQRFVQGRVFRWNRWRVLGHRIPIIGLAVLKLLKDINPEVGTAQSCLRETKVLRGLSGGTPTSTFQPSSSCSSSFSPSNVKCDLIPTLRDEFELSGPNGVHPCYTTVAAQSNLWETSYSRLFSCEVARAISAALVAAVAYIHTHGYVHGDIHLRNILVKLPTNFDKLSVDEFYKKYGKPETVPIRREDGKPLSSHIPSRAVKPLTLSNKPAWDFTLADARILLSDFGEAFSPAAEPRYIWSLGVAIWEIIGMKAILSAEYFTADEIISQQIDVLGPMPSTWWEKWQGKGKFFDENAQPKKGRHVWPAMNTAFEEGVQNYRQKNPNMGVFSEEESAAILDLIRRMLIWLKEYTLSILPTGSTWEDDGLFFLRDMMHNVWHNLDEMTSRSNEKFPMTFGPNEISSHIVEGEIGMTTKRSSTLLVGYIQRTLKPRNRQVRHLPTTEVPRSISPPMVEALCDYLLQKPGLYLDEMAVFLWDEFNVHVTRSGISRCLAPNGWSKKTVRQKARERNPDLRDLYFEYLSAFYSFYLVFIDESGCDKQIGLR
ncbi:hypothetical protein H109_02864 [Trichophyton interdigitale MR816]|uniref:Uncharacterized protein n=1 Tax=Trichophyton interdigitale (strain MR816) TaxID=1215338 RepID=A0A059JBN7_TRIIM|nr:hypothetical protein H109_02864 [Trichophyton interdigitale MR816]